MTIEKSWKRDMLCYIDEAFDPSLNENDNYDKIIDSYDVVFLDPDNLTKEDVRELGGSSKLVKRYDMYDDLSNEEQNEIFTKVEELIREYTQYLMDEEEDWIREKISKRKQTELKKKTLKEMFLEGRK